MNSFLNDVASLILKNHEKDLFHVCIVTPNRRSGLFLKKAFAHQTGQPRWAPDILSMEEFAESVSRFKIQEPVELILDFYKTYADSEQDRAESLEEFLRWAPMLLRDFNDIDAHMTEPRKIFENTTDVRRIESWNPDGAAASDFQKKYLAFFNKFSSWHSTLASYLASKQTGYSGLVYRKAAQNIANERFSYPCFVYFAGFNALSQAEEVMIRTLVKRKAASILWDTDQYYTDNPNHEAGYFFRKYKKNWNLPEFQFYGDHFSQVKKKIHIYGVAKNVNQAKLAANIVAGFPAESFTDHQTAIVLANEELLLPMLNSLPENVEKVNVTMGLPIRKTTVYALYDALFQLHITTARMKNDREGMDSVFYFKDIVRFFRHPAIAMIVELHARDFSVESFVRNIFESRNAFLKPAKLAGLSGQEQLFSELFFPFLEGFARSPEKIVPALLNLGSLLEATYLDKAAAKGVSIENTSWFTDFETLYSFNKTVRKLGQYISQSEHLQNLRVIYMLFQAIARESKLTLSGEPLAGLQIMGMLETRCLDFKNLVILSANEDILPTSKSNTSLIPFDVKGYFGLPLQREKDAIFGYHFYRLLQRAENIHIIYNTQTQDMGSSEKSRYITQLQMEMPAWNPRIQISEQIVPLPSASQGSADDIIISKDEHIMDKLEKINQKGFSPTTLHHFIRCSLFFYFRHVAEIQETIVPEETIQANTLGSVIHQALEKLYQHENLHNQIVNTGHIKSMLAHTNQVIQECFEDVYKGGDITTGKNLLLVRVANRSVKNFLYLEKKLIEQLAEEGQSLLYVASEEEMKESITMQLNGREAKLVFRGFADRIDKIGNQLRVIDYKTGMVKKDELSFKDWSRITEDPNLGKSFQLLMYAMLYKLKHGMPENLTPGIISFRNPGQGLLTLNFPGGSGHVDPEAIQTFEAELEKLMSSLFNPNTPFRKTEDHDQCKNCDFKVVCNR